jgi:L-amino acid N-acyltransferase YncA
MHVREARRGDLTALAHIFRQVVAAGDALAYPEGLDDEGIHQLWFLGPPGRCVVAVDDGDKVLGTAQMGPNRPGRGAHIATASFMVEPGARGRGVGRALGADAVAWAREAGFAGMQFNAVVETNTAAVRLWRSLGFEIMTTIPGAFHSARHGRVGLHVMYQRF